MLGKFIRAGLIFESRPGPTVNIKPIWIKFPRTNAPAYFAVQSVTKKKYFIGLAPDLWYRRHEPKNIEKKIL